MDFSKHVKVREEKFGSVVFETLKEKVYVTNETGSDILKLIREGQDKGSIVKKLCNVYDYDVDRINDEVTTFINQLRERGLLIE